MSTFGSNIFTGGTGASSTNNSQQSTSFGAKPSPGGSGGLFGSTATTNRTGGNIFGTVAPASSPAPTSSGTLFSGSAATTGPTVNSTTFTTSAGPSATLFGPSIPTTAPAAQTSSFFGSKPAATTPSASVAPTTSNTLFGGSGSGFLKPAEQSSVPSSKPATSSFFSQPGTSTGTTTTGGLFGQPIKPAESSKITPAAPATSTLGGGLFGKTAAPATSTLGAGLFAPTLKPPEKKDGATPAAPSTTSAPNLFGVKPEEKKDASGINVASAKPADTAVNSEVKPASIVSAVAVAPPSMLRGKTIEEIVNEWTTDLETRVREFNKFASEVAVWDRALIDNGNKLASLYSHVQGAEREQNDINQSLDHIEQQQKELTTVLDGYEKFTQEIFGTPGGSLRALDTGPADTERDKNYMLATDLHTQLEDLSTSLSQMIDAVNALSLPSDSASTDDPMAQISEILSSHLESLQWTDGAVCEVETKISEVEKRIKDSGHSVSNSRSKGFGLVR